ncbi:MAG TPA: hypothetical protein VK879_00290 [Candidatus Sulfomarinibacteraceae bacterium]|nr:hypothetical protein [Candidatus Sulfomarinibacteraceae bacterium]
MSNDAGYVLVALIILAFVAVLAPPANTQERADCIENSVSVNGETIRLQSPACPPPAHASTDCVESSVRVQGQDVHLRSAACDAEDAATEVAQVAPDTGAGPHPAAPHCPTHDPRAYHGLWDEERGCHYDHEHGDDPHVVDDVFGRAFYEWAGGEISYPWQTPGANDSAHGAYGWFVRRDLPCDAPFTDGCITDFRAQYHGLGAAQAAVYSFHSAWLEARVCLEADPQRCGIVRVGGWQGPADLVVDEGRVLDRENSGNRILRHYHGTEDPRAAVWYTGASSGLFSVVPRFEDMWNSVPPFSSPEAIVANSRWFCAGDEGQPDYEGCAHNSSRVGPHVIGVHIPAHIVEQLDVDPQGFATYRGYVNPLGHISDRCRAPGPTCIPFVVQDVATSVAYEYRGHAREYDICFAADGSVTGCDEGQPSGWLEFPMH